MSWRKELEQFTSDIIWTIIFIIIIVCLIAGGLWITQYNSNQVSNENKIIHSFVSRQLGICKEKLGAYGELTDFESNSVSIKALSICIDKLSIYEESTDLRQ